MAIVLTTPVAVPNVQRIVLVQPPRIHAGLAVCELEIRSGGGTPRVRKVFLSIRAGGTNGRSDRLMVNATPLAFDDDILLSPSAIDVTGADDAVEAAYRTGANKAAALRAVETYLLSSGIVQFAGTVA